MYIYVYIYISKICLYISQLFYIILNIYIHIYIYITWPFGLFAHVLGVSKCSQGLNNMPATCSPRSWRRCIMFANSYGGDERASRPITNSCQDRIRGHCLN